MAEFDDGRLNFKAGIDYSPVEKDVDEMVQIFESGAVKMSEAFNLGRAVDANRKQVRDMITTTKAAIRELEEEYRSAMRAIGGAGGLDRLTENERKWLDNLKEGIDAAKEQVKGLQERLRELNENKGGFISGLTSGVQGLMGAYTAASGVLARFNADEEKLLAIQTKLQSSMSILMGLQQVYNTLQSTSAFRLQIVTKLTDLYAKAQTRLAAATGLTKIALGGLVAVVAAAIGALVAYSTKQRDAFSDSAKVLDATAASAASQLTAYRKLQVEWDKANGSLEEQKKLLEDSGWDELGLAVSNVNEAESILVTNSNDVVQSFLLKAKAAQLYAEAQESIEKVAKKDLKADREQRRAEEGRTTAWDRIRSVALAGPSLISQALRNRYAEEGFKDGEYFKYEIPTGEGGKEGRREIAQFFAQSRARRLRNEADREMSDATNLLSEAGDLENRAEELVKAFGAKTKETAKKVVDEFKKEVEEVNRIISNAVNNLDDYEVSVIEDEGERSLAAMKLAHSRKLAEMEKERNELADAFRRQNALMGTEGVNPDTGLTAEQQDIIGRYTSAIEKTASQFNKEEAQEAAKTFNDLLVQYRGFGAKYVAETAEYERKRAELIKGTTEENKEEVADALDELEREYQKTLAELGQDLANSGKDVDFSKWVDQLADMSLMDMQIELQTKTDDLELLSQLFPEETEQVAELRAQIAMLNAALKAYKEEKTEATDKDKWTELAQVINIVRESINDLGDAIGGAFGDAIKSIGQTVSSLGQLVNAAKELEENPESMTARFSVAATAMQGVAGIIGTVINQVKASKEATEAWSNTIRECAHEYALLNIESQQYERRNIFGVENPYQKAIDSAKAYATAIEELQRTQSDLFGGKVQTGTKEVTDWAAVGKNAGYGASAGAAIGTAIGGWAAGLGTLIGGAIGAVVGGVSGLFKKKVVPVMEDLTKQYGQLFDPETYKLNPELLKDYAALDEDTKKVIDNWDEIVKKTEEAKNAMKENFSSLAGDIGSQLSDALVKAFTDGDIYAAVDDFHQYTTEAIQNIIEQMIFSQAFGDLFDELENKFGESFLGANADQNLVDDLIWFNQEYKKRLEDYNAMMTDAQDALGDLGFDLWGNAAGETRKAATRSSLGASQDSIDESNARLTAIQAHTYSINEAVLAIRMQNEELRLRSTEILAEVMGIHQDTTNAGLMMEEMMGYIKDVRLGVNTIVDKGVTAL